MTNEPMRAASPALRRILTISILGRFASKLAAGLKIPLDQFGALVSQARGTMLAMGVTAGSLVWQPTWSAVR